MTVDETPVLLTLEGDVHTITLNRPERLNAIDPATHDLLERTLREADASAQSRVIVITGAGRGFCAGGDVKGMAGKTSFGESARMRVLSPGRHLVDTLLRMEKPVIAKVNGAAAGLGATIALLSDIVIMSETAKIGDRHVNVGLVAGDGSGVIWPLLIGPSRAKLFLMTGRMIEARDAERMGLIWRAVHPDTLDDEVRSLAEELAALPPYAVQATKSMVNRSLQAMSGVILDTGLAYEHLSMHTADHQEALAAWSQKRPGVYVGH
ncbi:enoyl-CoA hydratase/isomerase family protein [Microbacterium sp. zg.B48]|uniref:enoyl-CoA hydratase/isomerase family protein n=1 Tax=Microbacterium sp. zg.B48 TaxID=2969408 RepID=UPI00214BD83C|nr:enoyl-CoA hydratase/isomerase family protein [Microbacterium sp. zg.B48]MCR2764332.1 enoyl-CoA hydratase/isomerase family protein [Microbacterium sp. zg.B48]